MEITVTTTRYTAQELQAHINGKGIMCMVLGGDNPNEYVIIVNSDMTAKLVRGMLEQLGIEEK